MCRRHWTVLAAAALAVLGGSRPAPAAQEPPDEVPIDALVDEIVNDRARFALLLGPTEQEEAQAMEQLREVVRRAAERPVVQVASAEPEVIADPQDDATRRDGSPTDGPLPGGDIIQAWSFTVDPLLDSLGIDAGPLEVAERVCAPSEVWCLDPELTANNIAGGWHVFAIRLPAPMPTDRRCQISVTFRTPAAGTYEGRAADPNNGANRSFDAYREQGRLTTVAYRFPDGNFSEDPASAPILTEYAELDATVYEVWVPQAAREGHEVVRVSVICGTFPNEWIDHAAVGEPTAELSFLPAAELAALVPAEPDEPAEPAESDEEPAAEAPDAGAGPVELASNEGDADGGVPAAAVLAGLAAVLGVGGLAIAVAARKKDPCADAKAAWERAKRACDEAKAEADVVAEAAAEAQAAEDAARDDLAALEDEWPPLRWGDGDGSWIELSGQPGSRITERDLWLRSQETGGAWEQYLADPSPETAAEVEAAWRAADSPQARDARRAKDAEYAARAQALRAEIERAAAHEDDARRAAHEARRRAEHACGEATLAGDAYDRCRGASESAGGDQADPPVATASGPSTAAPAPPTSPGPVTAGPTTTAGPRDPGGEPAGGPTRWVCHRGPETFTVTAGEPVLVGTFAGDDFVAGIDQWAPKLADWIARTGMGATDESIVARSSAFSHSRSLLEDLFAGMEREREITLAFSIDVEDQTWECEREERYADGAWVDTGGRRARLTAVRTRTIDGPVIAGPLDPAQASAAWIRAGRALLGPVEAAARRLARFQDSCPAS